MSNSLSETMSQLEESSQQRTQRQSDMSQAYYAQNTGKIGSRLKELDQEWTVEKVLKTAGTVATGYGLLSALVGRKCGVLLGLIAQSFSIQHTITGTCIPATLLHRAGLRTQKDVDAEKAALVSLKSK